MSYCIYLRKSRADLQAEAHGEGETLLRHETALLALAKRMQLSIGAIYREICSGETISDRPMMQKLLREIENRTWEGVLVMEIERLARGNTVDQGIIAQTFQYAGARIVTPLKSYEPGNEFDQEYFEFSLFMSRREYQSINRRMQRGRLASVMEGKFVGSLPPFGYQKIKLPAEKGYSLLPHPNQSAVVQRIFAAFLAGESAAQIASACNQAGEFTARGNLWSSYAILELLQNPVYCGKIRWNYRKRQKTPQNGKLTEHRPRSKPDELVITDGRHPALISPEQFALVQQRLSHGKAASGEKKL